MFICDSKVPLGDTLDKLSRLKGDDIKEKYCTLLQASKVLSADCEKCKKEIAEKKFT